MGKWADLVLWRPAFFGVKPTLILKGGAIAASLMGDANASIPTPQPVHYRPMFASYGGSRHATCLTFISQAAFDAGVPAALGLQKQIAVVKGCRDVQKTQYDFITNLFILNRWAGKLSEESVESVNVWLSNNSTTNPASDRNMKQ